MTSEQNPRTPRDTETLPPPGAAPASPPTSALSALTTDLTPPPAPRPPAGPPAPQPTGTTPPTGTPPAPRPSTGTPPAPRQAPNSTPRPSAGTAPAPRPATPAAPLPEARTAPRPASASDPLPPAAAPRRPATAPPAPRGATGQAGPPPPRPARPPEATPPARPVAAPRRPAGAAPLPPAGTGSAPLPPPRAADVVPAVETTTRLRPVRVPAYGVEETAVETTTRLRPIRERRRGRALAAAACVVLGVGLIGGALAGVWLAADGGGKPAEPAEYTVAKELWHNAPVDTLFPRTLTAPQAGPGPSARTWTRVVVAPDAPCAAASLAPRLLTALRPLGCERVLRATYTDATASSVLTVGLVFTRAEAEAQRALGGRGLAARLGQDVPPALPGPGTVAAGFGQAQRAGWWVSAPADLPVVVTAVSGFADGRAVDRAVPADQAMKKDRADAVAQSGLGHEALGIAEGLEKQLRTTALNAAKEEEQR
ncbi:hypothetical protein ABZ621_13380 [Streptomyces sp. NPDC007863]|uniref:hypothetical protein n=1 Tax=Streptomyces sp. NPDC007863 TaxID=3154894 RepID=UPI0033BFDA36